MAVFGRRRWNHLDCLAYGPLTPQDVLDMTFVVRKVRGGYDPDEVDDYLDSVAAAMAGFAPPVSAWDIRQHEFSQTRKFKSFDPEEVDNFLECIALTLEGRAGEYPPEETFPFPGTVEGQGIAMEPGLPSFPGSPGGQGLPHFPPQPMPPGPNDPPSPPPAAPPGPATFFP
jgi:DivIVA domain-containing protein